MLLSILAGGKLRLRRAITHKHDYNEPYYCE